MIDLLQVDLSVRGAALSVSVRSRGRAFLASRPLARCTARPCSAPKISKSRLVASLSNIVSTTLADFYFDFSLFSRYSLLFHFIPFELLTSLSPTDHFLFHSFILLFHTFILSSTNVFMIFLSVLTQFSHFSNL